MEQVAATARLSHAGRGPGDLPHRPRITGQLHVGREQRDSFGQRLRKQDAIERIFVQIGQGVDADSVFAGDRQFDISVVEEPTAHQARIDTKSLRVRGIS